MRKVFYCWQSDISDEINLNFIEECIDDAIKEVNEKISESENDPNLFVLDKDTSGVSGSPPVSDTILNKIDECTVFIADLTNVGEINTNPKKFVPNPNVSIEYGYALKTVNHQRIISIINKAYGDPEKLKLPFDINHLRWPIDYFLTDSPNADELSEQKNKLTKLIFEQLVIIFQEDEHKKGELKVELLEDQSKFYNLTNNKIVFRLKLKLTNTNNYDTTVKINKIDFFHNGNKYEALRTNIVGSLQTTSARVSFQQQDTINKDQDIRVNSYDSTTEFIAFEINKDSKFNFEKFDKIKVKGIAQSIDRKLAEFEGEVAGYY